MVPFRVPHLLLSNVTNTGIIVAIIFIIFLSWTSLCTFSWGEEPVGPSKDRLPSHNVPVESLVTENLIKTANLVITNSQETLRNIHTIFIILSAFVAILAFTATIMIPVFARRIERGASQLREIKGTVEGQKSTINQMNSELGIINEKAEDLRELFTNIDQIKVSIEHRFKEIASATDVLSAIFLLQDPNQAIRKEYLQILTQKKHPIGILPMVQILQNDSEDPAMRRTAAYGLGRYSENKDLAKYWGQIITALGNPLENKSLPKFIVIDATRALGKFGAVALKYKEIMLEWSEHDDKQVRLALAQAFGSMKIYDPSIELRLIEMKENEVFDEVRKAAEESLKTIEQYRDGSFE